MNTRILLTTIYAILSLSVQAQKMNGALYKSELQKLFINDEITLHFISPEPIQYVDISTKRMFGDIPVENVFRVKAIKDSIDDFSGYHKSLGIVTIIGQKFIAQYDLWYAGDNRQLETQVEILPINTNPLDVGATPLSNSELRHFSLQSYKQKTKMHAIKSTQYGITGQVNNIYTVDDYIFLDITFKNRTNLKFDLDQVRFKIDDKKITKATNVQSVEVEPEYKLFDAPSFKNKHRNIYVFRKFTYPNNKVLTIELSEEQISGRTLVMHIDYSDLLKADTL